MSTDFICYVRRLLHDDNRNEKVRDLYQTRGLLVLMRNDEFHKLLNNYTHQPLKAVNRQEQKGVIKFLEL
jgi:hypothetical protein